MFQSSFILSSIHIEELTYIREKTINRTFWSSVLLVYPVFDSKHSLFRRLGSINGHSLIIVIS